MDHYFKCTFIALLLLLSASALHGQTYFSLRLGGGLTDINKGAFFQGDPATTTYNWNFENQVVEHWAFGLMVEHQLDEKLFLAWTNTYYPNRIFEVYCNGVAPCNFFRFDSWRTGLAVKRSFADAVLLGMGLGLNYIHNPAYSGVTDPLYPVSLTPTDEALLVRIKDLLITEHFCSGRGCW